jgi:hypothetical protein
MKPNRERKRLDILRLDSACLQLFCPNGKSSSYEPEVVAAAFWRIYTGGGSRL